ncbi:hypothetical protein HYC85_013121 [Camellia sinensis]|uniref:CTP synthase (glutamine hydrolyzing) n=1 Tax=Camellia sinensis TaxID=4442 RepID=A0A7J7H5N6_CAMSI|nr:hypothetical protein HYC85_013121 [Camellia sinensis]
MRGIEDRGVKGMMLAAKYARENKVPYLGICLTMQISVIEYARSGSRTHMGSTMRLGCRETLFQTPDCITAKLYHNLEYVDERHRHRYEILELPGHPFYVGVQFHPEFKSRPGRPSAPFLATWMLDVSSTSVEAQLDVDFAEIYANSGLYHGIQVFETFIYVQRVMGMLTLLCQCLLFYANAYSPISGLQHVEKCLDVVATLQAKKGTGEFTGVKADLALLGDFEVSEGIYSRACIEDTDSVCLWLGANVMLEYSCEEATDLLQKNLENARASLEVLVTDLQFLRDQVTITQLYYSLPNQHTLSTTITTILHR